jgi:hypothetical protein
MHPTFAFDQFSTAMNDDPEAKEALDKISKMSLSEVKATLTMFPDEAAVFLLNLAQFYRLWRLHEEANRAPD